VYTGVQVWALLRPRLGWVLAVMVLSGIVGFQFLLLASSWLSAASSADQRVSNLQPPPAVERFLTGQATYDADLMWDALSADLQSAFAERGGSKEAMAAQAQSERVAGQRYREAAYIGGVPLQDNRWRFFYVVDIVSPAPERNGRFTFIFTTDRDGKIVDLKTVGK